MLEISDTDKFGNHLDFYTTRWHHCLESIFENMRLTQNVQIQNSKLAGCTGGDGGRKSGMLPGYRSINTGDFSQT